MEQRATIFTVVDRFTKMAKFVPLYGDTSAETVANIFFTKVVKDFGMLRSIISDHDRRFTGTFW